jgi:hypothetical protein
MFHSEAITVRRRLCSTVKQHYATPLTSMFHREAGTVLHHLCSTEKQALCCATYVEQRNSQYIVLLMFHSEGGPVLRQLSVKIHDCLECVASNTPLGQEGCVRHHKLFWPVSRCELFPRSLYGSSALCARGSSLITALSLYSFLPSNSLAIAYAQMKIDACESVTKF